MHPSVWVRVIEINSNYLFIEHHLQQHCLKVPYINAPSIKRCLFLMQYCVFHIYYGTKQKKEHHMFTD